MRLNFKKIAYLCLLLTLWSVVALVAHHHSSAADSSKCTVCVAAHSTAPKSITSLPNATFTPIFTFRPEPVSGSHRLIAFALSVRPPPQA